MKSRTYKNTLHSYVSLHYNKQYGQRYKITDEFCQKISKRDEEDNVRGKDSSSGSCGSIAAYKITYLAKCAEEAAGRRSCANDQKCH